jgi:hypothetical protein
MASVIKDKSLNSWEEALDSVLAEACMPELQHAVVGCFDCVTGIWDEGELRDMATDFVGKELKRRLRLLNWEASHWCVAVPRIRFAKVGLPRLEFLVDLYVAASAHADFWSQITLGYCQCVVVGRLRKEVAGFNAPLVLLKAIAEGNEGQFEIVAKEHHWTTWEVHGVEARLPDSLVTMVRGLKGKPLGNALEKTGLIAKGAGSLIEAGLVAPLPMTAPAGSPEVSTVATGDYDNLVAFLNEKMGYPKDEAEQAAKYVMEKFSSDSLENKIKQAVTYLSSQ